MSVKLTIAIALSTALGYVIGLETGDSDGDFTYLTVLACFFLGPFFVVAWLAWRPFRSVRRPLRQSALRLATLICFSLVAWAFGWWRVHPSNIRYQFACGTGASGTWREVKFQHFEDGEWIAGPWIGAWPMSVRFPDLDGDGHVDIEVSGHGKVSFVYLTKNDGHQYWHLHDRSGAYAVNYPPDNISEP